MSQRDYEDQPQAPDLGESVQDETGRTLTGPPNADPLDAGYVPPDRPYGLDDPEVTGDGDHERRLRRETSEVFETGGPDSDPGRAPRLVAAESGADGEIAESIDAVDAGLAGGAASAEEAAMHLTDASALSVGSPADGYLSDETDREAEPGP